MDVLDMQLADAAEYLEMGHYEKTLKISSRILAENPQQIEAMRMRGVAFYHSGMIEEALSAFGDLLQLDDQHVESWIYQAFCQRQQGEDEAALQSAQKAYEIAPDLLDALELLLILHAKADHIEEAETFAEKIHELEPQNGTVLLHRGDMYVRAERFAEARTDFLKLYELGYKEADLLNTIAITHTRADQFQEAIPYLKKALELSPYDATTLQNLGFALVQVGDEEGLGYLNKAVKYEPEDPMVYRLRGEAMLALEDLEGAKEDLLYAQSLGYADQYGEKVDELLASLAQDHPPQDGEDPA